MLSTSDPLTWDIGGIIDVKATQQPGPGILLSLYIGYCSTLALWYCNRFNPLRRVWCIRGSVVRCFPPWTWLALLFAAGCSDLLSLSNVTCRHLGSHYLHYLTAARVSYTAPSDSPKDSIIFGKSWKKFNRCILSLRWAEKSPFHEMEAGMTAKSK